MNGVRENPKWLRLEDVAFFTGRQNESLRSEAGDWTLVSSTYGPISLIKWSGIKIGRANAPKGSFLNYLEKFDGSLGEWLTNKEASCLLGLSPSFFGQSVSSGRRIERQEIYAPRIEGGNKSVFAYWIPGVERVVFPDESLRFIIHPDNALDGRLRSVVYDIDAIPPVEI